MLSNEKLDANALADEELKQVNGGKAGVYHRINLTGPYWGTTFQEQGPYYALIGAADLLVEEVLEAKGPCKYRISRYGQYMGWTFRNNFQYI